MMCLKKYLLLICLLAVLPSLGLAESEIAGWGKTKWGMTQAEVKKIYELNPWEPGSIPICKMKQKIKIMGHDFAAEFLPNGFRPAGVIKMAMGEKQVFDFETVPVSLRSALDIRRACNPTC